MKIGIVTGSSSKLTHKAKAKELYSPSALFSHAFAYCEREYDKTLILSPKHGFIEPDDIIEPYNVDITKFRFSDDLKLVHKIIKQAKNLLKKKDDIYIHVGDKYSFIFPELVRVGYHFINPMKGIGGIGKQLQFYKKASDD